MSKPSSTSPLPIDALSAPLAGADPCGPNLEYDPAFAALLDAAAGKPERQFAATVVPAEPPDWIEVQARALDLAARTRDLRVAVWLLRSRARVAGIVGAVEALRLLLALVEQLWPHLHPLPDPDEPGDPTARLNALAPLHHEDGLADLRAAGVQPGRGALTVREIALVFGRAEPHAGETVPAEAAALAAIAAAQVADPALGAAMHDAPVVVQALAAALDQALGGARSPELAPLLKLMQPVALAGLRAAALRGEPIVVIDAVAGAPTVAQAAAANPGQIQNREDAIRTLGRVCEWLEQHEPAHPAPLLIARAQRLLAKKNFLDVIRDLVPEGLGQIEKIAGPGRD